MIRINVGKEWSARNVSFIVLCNFLVIGLNKIFHQDFVAMVPVNSDAPNAEFAGPVVFVASLVANWLTLPIQSDLGYSLWHSIEVNLVIL